MLKNFAVAISVVVSSCVSATMMEFTISPIFVFGAFIVVTAAYTYNISGVPSLPKESDANMIKEMDEKMKVLLSVEARLHMAAVDRQNDRIFCSIGFYMRNVLQDRFASRG